MNEHPKLQRRRFISSSLAFISTTLIACTSKSEDGFGVTGGSNRPADDDDDNIDLPQPSQPSSEPDSEPSEPDDPPENAAFVIDMNEYPHLREVGGVQFFVTDRGTDIAVTRTGEDEITAVSILCPVDDCKLELYSDAQDPRDGLVWFTCPCCSSTMDAKGVVIDGPAENNLEQFNTNINGNEIFVYGA